MKEICKYCNQKKKRNQTSLPCNECKGIYFKEGEYYISKEDKNKECFFIKNMECKNVA